MDFNRLDQFARHEGGISRRLFTSYLAGLSAVPWIGLSAEGKGSKTTTFSGNPFSLGVASGDPDHEGMVLWTKLAPEPLEVNGGMPIDAFTEVTWEVAHDEGMQDVVLSGTALATPHLGHTIHVETHGLEPDRWYSYRFRVGDYASPVGRTRTMPENHVLSEKLRFAVTSCQNFEQGLYTAYEQMMADDPDLVFHLGDYIYEYAGKPDRVRTHLGPEIENLEQYRSRYNQYRTDPLLQQMHAHCPWWLTWDDHEFDNNCAGDISEETGIDKVAYLKRRAAAYQAYYEMMPLRASACPVGPDMKLYRGARFGRLADFHILDTRQYRTDQPNGDRNKPLNDAALSLENTMLGHRQRGWLQRSLIQSPSQWNVLTQQVMMGMANRQTKENDEAIYSMDQWPGYAAEKMALMRFLQERHISNPIVLTGDIHSNWVNELRVDDLQPEGRPIATEFVATSLSSGGNGEAKRSHHDLYLSNNPGTKFYNAERGYILCDLTPERWISQYKVVDDVLKPGGKTTVRASFLVNTGDATVHSM
ncbi:MAG: alkaline phosphatase D family protein [Verrucomicrobiales bacterium]|nr:alkaline phosphatase D family protein [Verrucomicrobiales bacterium]